MENTDILPVIGGLATGITLVVTFAMFFGSSSAHDIGRYSHMGLSIDGLKQTYSIGEEIDFTLTAKGYGKYCPYGPSIAIFDSAGNAVWTYETFNLMGCGDPDISAHEVDEKWSVKEKVSLLPSSSNIQTPKINEPGEYKLIANYYDTPVYASFTVVN